MPCSSNFLNLAPRRNPRARLLEVSILKRKVRNRALKVTSRNFLGETTPAHYTLEEYYKEDELGQEVLQKKYLAPWENNPYDMWKRIAKAMASVEKDIDLWYKRFFTILEDFRFVPGGRIMHGAGRDDITTTLNNCYVIAIKKDSIKSYL